MIVLAWFWSPQLHLGASSTVVIKECSATYFDPVSGS